MIGSGLLIPAFALLAMLACALLIADERRRRRTVGSRIEEARQRAFGLLAATPHRRRVPITRFVTALGTAIAGSGLLSAKTREELELTLNATGAARANSLGMFVGTKILLAIMLPAAVFMALHNVKLGLFIRITAVAGSAVVGLIAPDMIIGRMRSAHRAAVEAGLADGLDMMVICAEAGLALEAVVRRVSVEIVHAHPKLAAEMAITSSELSLIPDARVALTNLGNRTGLLSLKRLGTTLLQSMKYGTPLSAALRSLSIELRQETLTRFEERAARLPVLLTVPMILFILPCVFLIVAGPIVVQVIKAMKHH